MNTMLIDTTHADETVSIILSNNELISVHHDSGVIKKGNIYQAIISNIDHGLNAVFLNFGGSKAGFLSIDNIHDMYFNGKERSLHSLHKDQIFLVQIEKEERSTKGAFLTTYICLSGRYCILMIDSKHSSGGVSKKIMDSSERERLNHIRENLKLPDGMSVILRTAVNEADESDIKRDCMSLLRLWKRIQTLFGKGRAACLLHSESNGVTKTLRELYTVNIECIRVLTADDVKEAKRFFQLFLPRHKIQIELMNKSDYAHFSSQAFENYIKKLLNRHIELPSGGYITITPTDALHAIDVNSGKTKQSIVQINMEAAEACVQQILLKNLYGLIVIDFIDMYQSEHLKMVEQIVKNGLKFDKARLKISAINNFGLMEISRQRIQSSVYEWLLESCKKCNCIGSVVSVSFLARRSLRAIFHQALSQKHHTICVVHLPRDVFSWIMNEKLDFIYNIKTVYNVRLKFIPGDFKEQTYLKTEWY